MKIKWKNIKREIENQKTENEEDECTISLPENQKIAEGKKNGYVTEMKEGVEE